MSCLKSIMLYACVSLSWTTEKPPMNAASRVSDCLPLPPTPTNSALPRGLSRMREMRQTWPIACSKSTRSIVAFASLYSASFPSSVFFSRSPESTG